MAVVNIQPLIPECLPSSYRTGRLLFTGKPVLLIKNELFKSRLKAPIPANTPQFPISRHKIYRFTLPLLFHCFRIRVTKIVIITRSGPAAVVPSHHCNILFMWTPLNRLTLPFSAIHVFRSIVKITPISRLIMFPIVHPGLTRCCVLSLQE